MMSPIPNNEHLKNLLAQDQQAYEILLNKYEASVYRFFYYSHGNHEMAQDQCGETFARFVASIKKFTSNHPGSLRAFIFGIARNVLLQGYRNKRLIKENISSLEEVPSSKPSVFQEVSSRDELVFALNIINQFQDPEKQILLLRFVEGLKPDEIAGIMNTPINSVKSHIHRSRKKLCEKLSKNKPWNPEVKNYEKQ